MPTTRAATARHAPRPRRPGLRWDRLSVLLGLIGFWALVSMIVFGLIGR